ncbi:hypothetical protein [Nocardia sp. NPDC056000]|uniref:DUF7373 family lipoprotein n=1 Tax=Nocardia sp. NPDC056000 TaxID=3345674 RepID=UPI0035D831B6
MTNDEFRRRARRRAMACAASLTVLAGVLGGCGGEVVPGNARQSTPNLAALDMGELSAQPIAVPANDNDTYGRVMESARLAEVVVKPADFDKDLSYGGSALLPTPGRTAVLAPEIALQPIAQYGMIAGYAVNGTDSPATPPAVGDSKILRMTVLSFRADPIARLVAGRIAAADMARNPDTIRIAIPGFDDAYGISRKRSPVLVTALAHKSFVVVVYAADRVVDAAALSARASAALAAELPLLDGFVPTAPDKLSAMPFDGDDMLRRLLHPDATAWPYPAANQAGTPADTNWFGFAHGTGVVYGPRGITHLFGQGGAAEKFEPDPIERAAFIGDWWLMRLSDLAHTRSMHDRVVAAATANGDTPVATPAGVPDAACFRGKDVPDNARETRYRCFLMDGRYWAVVSGQDEKTARQRAAAQYALLVNTR